MGDAESGAAACWAVIVAAGRGARMGGGIAKQFRVIGDRTVLEWSLLPLLGCAEIRGIVVVLAEPVKLPLMTPHLAASERLTTATGGVERADSVLAGLAALASQGARERDWVLVHDAARPCLRDDALQRLLLAATPPDGALLAMPVADTLKRGSGTPPRSEGTVARKQLWRAQTPQIFPLGLLCGALRDARASGLVCSDEAQAMESAGYSPQLVPGDATNFKITTVDDMRLAEALLLFGR